MEDPSTKLSSKSLLVLYNSLSYDEQDAFNLALQDNIRRSQLKKMGAPLEIQDLLYNDFWVSTELRAGNEDILLGYIGKISLLQKRAKYYRLTCDGSDSIYIFIRCNHDNEIVDDTEGGWLPYDLQAIASTGSSIAKWFVSWVPNSDYEGIVASNPR